MDKKRNFCLGYQIDIPLMISFSSTRALRLCDGGSEDVGVTGIKDGHGGATEELTGGGTELNLHDNNTLASVLLSKALSG